VFGVQCSVFTRVEENVTRSCHSAGSAGTAARLA
jgi:hypothetical protein